MFNFLQPKLRHPFILQVTDADGTYNPEYDIFTSQLISVDLGSELLLEDSLKQHKTNRIVLWLEDDATCKLIRTIRNMQAEPRQVNVDVFLVNGNEDVLERYSYKLATAEAMQHSMLSYKVNIPFEGHVTCSQSKSCSMKLLQFFFLEFDHQIYDEPCNVRAIFAKVKEPTDGE